MPGDIAGAGVWGGGMETGVREELYRAKRKHLRVTDLSTILIAVTGSQLHKLCQTYQIIYSKYVQFMICDLYLNKAVKMHLSGFRLYIPYHA